MKRTKIVSAVLVVIMLFISTVPAIATSSETLYISEVKTAKLSGFSYDMEGRQIDSKDLFMVNVSYNLGSSPWITISGLNKLDVLRNGDTTSRINLNAIGSNIYYGDIYSDENIVGYVYLEIVDGSPIVDILIDNRCYALGNNRREKIAQELQKIAVSNNEETINEPLPKASAGLLFTKSNSKIYCQAAYNPTYSNRIDIRVHTKTSQTTTYVTKCVITGTLPSSYIVVSCNPFGLTSSMYNDWVFIINLVLSSQNIHVALPGQNASTLSSWAGNSFTFNFSGNAQAWNNLMDTGSGTRKGFAGHVFLDHNGVTPTFSGSVKITYHISMVGSFTETLSL